MIDNTTLSRLSSKLTDVRAGLLTSSPFYGRLLLRLRFGFAECGTAFTDMKKIVFDPEFAERLDVRELGFVMMHELMHCVLHHCTRGRSLRPLLYNVACDIVVNSLIMEVLGVPEFTVDGCPAMHLAPNGREGREYSAEEVYGMLLRTASEKLREFLDKGFDVHAVWERISDPSADDEWNRNLREAAGYSKTGSGIPGSLKRYLAEIYRTPRTNWRQLLHDFIQNDRSDFVYSVPDRRFRGDIIMPSFQENVYGGKVDRLWFAVDTSGSVSKGALTEAVSEIASALAQLDSLSGEISFFDTQVSEPVPFESQEELSKCEPVGGGGTSFEAIFRFMEEHYKEELPRAVIILTDGHAVFPDGEAAHGVPVLWIIINSPVEAPWGECIHVDD